MKSLSRWSTVTWTRKTYFSQSRRILANIYHLQNFVKEITCFKNLDKLFNVPAPKKQAFLTSTNWWSQSQKLKSKDLNTASKVFVFGVILVRIFPHLDWITPNTDTFYAVKISHYRNYKNSENGNFCQGLTHFYPVSHFYTPWKHQKTKGFLTFSGGIEMWHWTKMGQKKNY